MCAKKKGMKRRGYVQQNIAGGILREVNPSNNVVLVTSCIKTNRYHICFMRDIELVAKL